MNSSPGQRFVEWAQIVGFTEKDVGGPFHLHHAPVVATRKVLNDWTEEPSPTIETTMQSADVQLISETLSLLEVFDFEEDILRQRKVDSGLSQLRSKVVVTVEVELEPEGAQVGTRR